MENVTISDIAKEAKVSIATVSNVLNNKGNVKIETIRRVEETSKRLGYVRNENAQIMKKGDSNVVFFLVQVLNGATSPLVIDLIHNLKMENIDLRIIEIENFHSSRLLINQLKQGQYKAVICLASIRDKKLISAIDKKKLIFIDGQSNGANKVEIDMSALVKFLDSKKNYTVITDEKDFALYKKLQQESENPQLDFQNLDKGEIPESFSSKESKNFIVFSPDMIDKLITFYENIEGESPNFILVSCKSSYHFYSQLKVNNFYFSSNEISLKLINIIRSISKKRKKSRQELQRVKLYLTDLKKFDFSAQKTQVKLLLLKNPFSKALKKLAYRFSKETNIELLITELPFSEIQQLIENGKIHDYDIIRLDVSYFPWIGPELFLNLDTIPPLKELARTMSDWKNYSYVQQELLALPADPSIQMMLYRKDVFEHPIIQKAYSESHSKKLAPPKTYQNMQEYCSFYQQMDIPEKKIPFPLSVNDGNGVLLASEFLPYFFSFGGEIKFRKDLFEVSSEPFIKTLEISREIRTSAKVQHENWWDSEIENFNNSKSAIIIGYTNHLNQISQVDYGYAALPGNAPAFGGGVLGITKNSANVKACSLFFQWLYQYRIQEQLANAGVCVPRTHLFDERNNFRKFPFLSYSSKNFSLGTRLQYHEEYVMNTIGIENILGNEINQGLKKGASNLDILINIHNQLNSKKHELIRKCV